LFRFASNVYRRNLLCHIPKPNPVFSFGCVRSSRKLHFVETLSKGLGSGPARSPFNPSKGFQFFPPSLICPFRNTPTPRPFDSIDPAGLLTRPGLRPYEVSPNLPRIVNWRCFDLPWSPSRCSCADDRFSPVPPSPSRQLPDRDPFPRLLAAFANSNVFPPISTQFFAAAAGFSPNFIYPGHHSEEFGGAVREK